MSDTPKNDTPENSEAQGTTADPNQETAKGGSSEVGAASEVALSLKARGRQLALAVVWAPWVAVRGALAFARNRDTEGGGSPTGGTDPWPAGLDRLPGLRWWCLGGVLLGLVVAYGGALATPFHGDDFEVLLRAAGVDPSLDARASDRLAPEPRPAGEELARAPDGPLAEGKLPSLWRMAPIDVINIVGDDSQGDVGSLLSGYSLALSLRLWGAEPTSLFGWPTALFYRLENLLWLGSAAIAMWYFARRVALPWIGSEQAWAAATAAALMFVVHPLCVPSVVSLSGRSDLMALTFAMFCAAAFLRGRQERMPPFVLLAGLLCVAAGLSGQLALVLPFGLAISELASSRRFRAQRRRLNTAINSLLIFSVGVQLNVLAVSTLTGHGYYPRVGYGLAHLFEPGALGSAIVGALRKLGLVLLPANTSSLGPVGVLLAGALLLLALQPMMAAVRNAPRLWGWVGVWFGVALFGAFLFSIQEPASLEGLAAGRSLLPAATVVCAGLGLSATALSGTRRVLVPWVLGAGYAILALGNAQPWSEAGYRLERLTDQLQAARLEHPAPQPLLIVDAPRNVRGLDPLGRVLPWLLHPLFGRGGSVSPERFADAPRDTVLHVLRSDQPVPWSADTLLSEFDAQQAMTWALAGSPPLTKRAERLVEGPVWDVDDELDGRSFGALRARLTNVRRKSREPWRVRWSSDSAQGELPLLRLPAEGGEAFLIADLEGDLDWRFAGKVNELVLEPVAAEDSGDAGRDIDERETVVELRALTAMGPNMSAVVGPILLEGRWFFGDPPSGLWELAQRGQWHVALLRPAYLERVEFRLREARDGLRSRPMERWMREIPEDERLLWELEYRQGNLVCVRYRGSLVMPVTVP